MEVLLLPLTDLFSWVLRTSWQASVVALIILVVQGLLRRQLNAPWRYGLWLLLVIRLLTPNPPPSAWSIFNLVAIGPSKPLQTEAILASDPEAFIPLDAGRTEVSKFLDVALSSGEHLVTVSPALPPASLTPSNQKPFPSMEAGAVIWALGVLALAFKLLVAETRLRRRLANAQNVAHPKARAIFESCHALLGLKQQVALVETQAVDRPSVRGFWRMQVLLPRNALARYTDNELRWIFLHELAHLRRRDLEVHLLTLLLGLVHGLNPVLR